MTANDVDEVSAGITTAGSTPDGTPDDTEVSSGRIGDVDEVSAGITTAGSTPDGMADDDEEVYSVKVIGKVSGSA